MKKDNLEILLEDIRGKFDLVLEGHEGLRKEIRDTRHELCNKIEFVDFKVEAVNQKLDGVAAETRTNTVAIKDLTHKIDGVTAEVAVHTVAIRDMGHKLDDVAAETRTNTVAIKDLTHKIDGLTAEVAVHTVAIRDMGHKLDDVADNLSAHRTDTEVHNPVYRVKE
jgi:predicted  nucleic acid-binding Zn-ribbon protein